MHLLPLNLGCVADAATPGDRRFALEAVHIKCGPADDEYMVEATDTRMLVRVTGLTPNPHEYPAGEMPHVDDEGRETCVPADAFKSLMSDAAKYTKKVARTRPILAHVMMQLSPAGATCSYTDNVDPRRSTTLPVSDGRFPPTNAILLRARENHTAATIRVSAKRLAALMKILSSLFDKDDDASKECFVDMAVPSDPARPLMFTARTGDNQNVEAVLMTAAGA